MASNVANSWGLWRFCRHRSPAPSVPTLAKDFSTAANRFATLAKGFATAANRFTTRANRFTTPASRFATTNPAATAPLTVSQRPPTASQAQTFAPEHKPLFLSTNLRSGVRLTPGLFPKRRAGRLTPTYCRYLFAFSGRGSGGEVRARTTTYSPPPPVATGAQWHRWLFPGC